jgi:polar amino acid transport system substrate-binding protein
MKRLFLLLCVVFLLVEINSAAAAQSKILKIGVASWPPYVDKEHIAYGVVPEIIQLSFLNQNVDVEFVVLENWAACQEALLIRKIDASGPYTPTEERKKKLSFSKHPLVELNTAVFYLRKNSAKVPNANLFENQKTFSGFVIGGVRGYFYEDLLKTSNIVYVSQPYENFQKLYLGKVDLVIENELIGWNTLTELFPYSISQFAELSESKATHGGYLVVNKNDPEGSSILKTFDMGLEKLHQNGMYEEVIQKYKENFKRLF